jgi:hypothetical protein
VAHAPDHVVVALTGLPSGRPTGRLTALGSALAIAGAAHCVVNATRLRRPSTVDRPVPTVSVLIPARDEAGTITRCVSATVGQDAVAEVIVLDDGSTDGTAELAAAAGARVVRGSDPPDGWLGKTWACAQLVSAVDDDLLVFVDADVELAPGAVRAAVTTTLEHGLDIVCPFPRQLTGSASERLVQPLLQWSWLTTLPLRVAERSARASLTAASGQFVIVRRSALERAGGFAAVRGAVLDDIALVRAIKASGGRGGVIDGSELAACRMYDGWSSLRDGYGKSLWSAFGSPAGALAVAALLAGTYVLPAVAMLRGSRLGALGYAAGLISRVVAGRVTGARVWPDALAHPASIAVFDYLVLRSLIEHRRGTLTWKGRAV